MKIVNLGWAYRGSVEIGAQSYSVKATVLFCLRMIFMSQCVMKNEDGTGCTDSV